MKVLFDGFGVTHHIGNSLGSYSNEITSLINNSSEDIDFNILLYNLDRPISKLSFANTTPLYLNLDRSDFPSSSINEIMNKYVIDVYHDPNNGFLAPKDKVPNYIVSLNTLLPYLEPNLVDENFKRNFLKRVPYSLEISKNILVPSNSLKEDLIKTFPNMEDKIRCVYPKINDIFTPKDLDISKQFILKNYNISSQYILYVGDISKRKYIENLIFIMKNLSATPLKLVLIGDYKGKKYSYYKHITDLISSLSLDDKIIFLGKLPQESLPYFYSSALCTIDLSLYNSYPLSTVEAIHCNSVTIVNDTPPNREILNNSSFFVNSSNISLAVDMIKTLIEKNNIKSLLSAISSKPISGDLHELVSIYNG